MQGYEDFIREARRIANVIRDAEHITIFSHIDADGISAGCIALQTARRLGKEAELRFLKKLDGENIASVRETEGLVWMNDMGSGYLSRLEGKEMIIADHHEPETHIPLVVKDGIASLGDSTIHHLNAHLFGIDGGTEISSSGTAYFIAKGASEKNVDLSTLALTGAIGDLQDSRFGRLVGLNRMILQDAVGAGLVSVTKDANFFGKETRPISRLLEYSVDPPIPGISGNHAAAERLLLALGIDYTRNGEEITWSRLSIEEKRRVMSFIVQQMIASHISPEKINGIVGENYRLVSSSVGLSDLKEFATLLNACGRYGKFETAVKLCTESDLSTAEEAKALLESHRKNISSALRLIREVGLGHANHIYYFHAGDRINDTIIGTIAGILIKSGEVDSGKVIVGFASSEGKIKVSARGSDELLQRGLNLSEALHLAAEHVGGLGGGHDIAAGATIDVGKEDEFIRELDKVLDIQLSGGQCVSS
ncbi:MAG: DHH family phosphoesterase [Methanomassiliicoccales archaeon]